MMSTRKETKYIVVHHTAFAQDVSKDEIDRWHFLRKFGPRGKAFGYHFLIHREGNYEVGRPIDSAGAHARAQGRNFTSVGICLAQGGGQEFTTAQYVTLAKLVKSINTIYGKKLILEKHHEECPGDKFSWETLARLVGE